MVKRRTLAPLATLLVLVMAFLVPASHAFARQARPQGSACCASLSITPKTATILQTVHITGSGFFPGEVVNLSFGYDFRRPPAYTGRADASGHLSLYRSIPIMGGYQDGNLFFLVAVGQFSNQSAETSFKLRSTLTLSTSAGPPGTLVRYSINGFGDSDYIYLLWDTAGPALDITLLLPESRGTFTGRFTVPQKTTLGKHTVTAYGLYTTATVEFNVLGQ